PSRHRGSPGRSQGRRGVQRGGHAPQAVGEGRHGEPPLPACPLPRPGVLTARPRVRRRAGGGGVMATVMAPTPVELRARGDGALGRVAAAAALVAEAGAVSREVSAYAVAAVADVAEEDFYALDRCLEACGGHDLEEALQELAVLAEVHAEAYTVMVDAEFTKDPARAGAAAG